MAPDAQCRDFIADAQGLAVLDDWLESATAGWSCRESVLRARVCAAELAANLMEHGLGPQGAARLKVSIACEGSDVRLELEDDGRAFDPTQWRPSREKQTLRTAPIGGRGLRTVQGLARELRYQRRNDRNCISLLVAGS
jgi:anti-sigma regulatory factor (Ser/Thr protein kinase)